MGSWSLSKYTLCPKSYRNLLLRQSILLEGKPDASRATAARWILRRLEYQDEHKFAVARAVNRRLEKGEEIPIAEGTAEELGVDDLEPHRAQLEASIRVSLRLDPWSEFNLRLRQGVLQARLGKQITKAEALRRILRRRQFTPEQERFHEGRVLAQIREDSGEVYRCLVEGAGS